MCPRVCCLPSFSFSFFPKSLWFCFVDIWLLRNFKKKKRKENGIFALACGWINIFNILVCFSNYLSNSNLSGIFPWNSCVWGDYILYLVVEKRRRSIALHYGSIVLLYNIYIYIVHISCINRCHCYQSNFIFFREIY